MQVDLDQHLAPKATVALYLRAFRVDASSTRQAAHERSRPRRRAPQHDRQPREAQVIYDLPHEKVGNDNWVEFTLHGGQWKVSNCHAPILGHSSSSSSATGTASPSEPTPTRALPR